MTSPLANDGEKDICWKVVDSGARHGRLHTFRVRVDGFYYAVLTSG